MGAASGIPLTPQSLDVDSVRTLGDLARRWGVSKSEVIRRALRLALVAGAEPGAETTG